MRDASGFSLIELLVAMAIALTVLGAASFVLTHQLSHGQRLLAETRLHAQARALLERMARDLRRAGYREHEQASADFDLRLPATSCVLYSYDRYADGVASANERFGFKWQRVDGVGVLRMRKSGAGLADCAEGSWETLSDPASLEVTSLEFVALDQACYDVAGATRRPCPPRAGAGERLLVLRELEIRLWAQDRARTLPPVALTARVALPVAPLLPE